MTGGRVNVDVGIFRIGIGIDAARIRAVEVEIETGAENGNRGKNEDQRCTLKNERGASVEFVSGTNSYSISQLIHSVLRTFFILA